MTPVLSSPLQPSSAGLYDECKTFQARSTELVVFCTSVGQPVEIAWPMQNGIRIQPQGVRAWLRKRGLHWPCFCVLEMDTSLSCQIIHALDGRVMAFCSQSPSKCGFRMNLSDRFRSALLESNYQHLYTLDSGNVPDMGAILSAFIMSGALDPCPYFEGYCGEHQYEYPGLEQKSGPHKFAPADGRRISVPVDYDAVRLRKRAMLDHESAKVLALISARPKPPPASSAHTRIIRRPTTANAIAGPSAIVPPADHSAVTKATANYREVQLLTTLANGNGISSYDIQGFIEKCGICQKFFLSSVLPFHIPSCS